MTPPDLAAQRDSRRDHEWRAWFGLREQTNIRHAPFHRRPPRRKTVPLPVARSDAPPPTAAASASCEKTTCPTRKDSRTAPASLPAPRSGPRGAGEPVPPPTARRDSRPTAPRTHRPTPATARRMSVSRNARNPCRSVTASAGNSNGRDPRGHFAVPPSSSHTRSSRAPDASVASAWRETRNRWLPP